MIQIDIVETALDAPSEDLLEQRQRSIALKSLLERRGKKGAQPIVFGTDVACMRIVSDAGLIGESLDAGTWLCGEVRFSLG